MNSPVSNHLKKIKLEKGVRSCIGISLSLCLLIFSSCVSHLKEAKFYYDQGEGHLRMYQTEEAMASFKKAVEKAEIKLKNHASAQLYMVKGLSEIRLELWEEAERSFLKAFSLGYEKGEEWAKELSLFGLASTMEEFGLEDSALKVYEGILSRSKFTPMTVLAAQKYMDISLKKALQMPEPECKKELIKLIGKAEKLTEKDLSCGYFHYVQSQIYSHLGRYRKSFEEAVMAKELGLPSEEISRDNDLQIIFCYKELKSICSPGEWDSFQEIYSRWVKKWHWKDSVTPDWKTR